MFAPRRETVSLGRGVRSPAQRIVVQPAYSIDVRPCKSYRQPIAEATPTAIVMFGYRIGPLWIGLTIARQLALLSTLLFRYSRTGWMHLDTWIDPR